MTRPRINNIVLVTAVSSLQCVVVFSGGFGFGDMAYGDIMGEYMEDGCCDYPDMTGGAGSGGGGKGKHRQGDPKLQWKWSEGPGLGLLITMILFLVGLVTILVWLFYKIFTNEDEDDMELGEKTLPPDWSEQLVFKPEMAVGFGLISEGLTKVGPGQLLRRRQGTRITDGALWGAEMISGKHVFEITWPKVHRGSNASVGIGTPDAPIKGKGSRPLVGATDQSWGLDMVERLMRHAKKPVAFCPNNGSMVPETFQMYVDVDEGLLGFGSDITYWGDVIGGLPKQGESPLYVMVGTARWEAEITVQYKGSAPDDSICQAALMRRGTPKLANVQKTKGDLSPEYAASSPPTYSELDERKEPFADSSAAAAAGVDAAGEQPCVPPPPYVSAPVGTDPAVAVAVKGDPSKV